MSYQLRKEYTNMNRDRKIRELIAYLRSKEQIGIIDVVRTQPDSVELARQQLERGLIDTPKCLEMMSDNPGVIVYNVGQKIWKQVLAHEVKKILPDCRVRTRKLLHGTVDVYINLNPYRGE